MKPLYGIIPYFGKEYTVVFKEKNNIRKEIRGYGDFPFEKYPDIPVIDLYNDNKVIEFMKIQSELRPKEENSDFYYGTMKTFLSEVKLIGINIIFNRRK